MEKDFEKWHSFETKIEHQHKSLLFREREVWWCSLGVNIGAEQDGKNDFLERPTLVIRKFNADLFWGIPMSSKQKVGMHYYNFFFQGEPRVAILSQIRILSSKRLLRRIGKISLPQAKLIEYELLTLLLKKTEDPLRGLPRVLCGNFRTDPHGSSGA